MTSAANSSWLLSKGQLADHYRVVRPIGRGGMAEVYLARDTQLGRRVAIKVLLGEADEGVTTARFNHPNIVTIHGVGEVSGRPYLALEFLEGQTLRHRMDRRRPGIPEAMRIALAMSRALAAAHGAGVLHRDLKPDNVMLGQDGRVRVLDFGLALSRTTPAAKPESADKEPSPELEATLPPAGVQGTPAYMAPEQWEEEALTARTDIWALGIIFFELLTGQRPYREASSLSQALRVCDRGEAAPQVQVDGVSPELVDLVRRCLDKEPEGRPEAGEVAEALQGLLNPLARSKQGISEPFRGLSAFNEQHSSLFFGRDGEIGQMVERLRREVVLPVVGPSGAGKSSLVRAGVIPRLREQGAVRVLEMRPGRDPFAALNACLARAWPESGEGKPPTLEGEALAASPALLNLALSRLAAARRCRVLLLVDQLEELYTMAPGAGQRRAFMEAVCSAADDPEGPVRVVFTLREEFLSRLAEGEAAREAMGHIALLGPPEAGDLELTLTQPLSLMGYRFDDDELPREMVAEVAGAAGCLPLLQFTARLLWKRRDRQAKLLLRSAYEDLDGVAGALARHADGVLAGLSDGELDLARTVVLRMVTSQGTRRIVPREQLLAGLPEAAGELLGRLMAARLITARRAVAGGESELELVHESLMESWSRLKRWIDESREELVFLEEVGQAARLWARRGRRDEEVWEGRALEGARQALDRLEEGVPPLTERFIQAGEAKARQAARRRRWSLAGVFTLLALVALGAVLAALVLAEKEQETRREKVRADAQRQEAERQRTRAVRRGAEALREGARLGLARGDYLEARARLRGSLEAHDSTLARALWRRLSRDPLVWRHRIGAGVYEVAISPDGETVAAGSQDRSIYLVNRRTRAIEVIRGHKDQVTCVTYSPDGRLLAFATWEGEVWLRRLKDGKETLLKGHASRVEVVAFSPSGELLATAGHGGEVRIWRVKTGALERTVPGNGEETWSLAFTPDGKLMATGGADGKVRFWDPNTGEARGSLTGPGAKVRAVAISPDGKLLAAGSSDRTLGLWNLPGREPVRSWAGHQGSVWAVAFSPDGELLASAAEDHTVKLWSAQDGTHRSTLEGHHGTVWGLSFAPGGHLLATGSRDNTLCLWDLRRVRPTHDRGSHSLAVVSAAFSPDGAHIASVSEDRTLRLWDAAKGTGRVLAGPLSAALWNVAISPGGELIATASEDRGVRLWNVVDGKLVRELSGHTAGVVSANFSPDGKRLASAGLDGTVRLWEVATGRTIAVLKGHRAGVLWVVFDPSGKRLASGGMDSTVRVWQARARGKTIQLLKGHKAWVWGGTFSPDGRRLATAGDDRTLWLWDLARAKGQLVARHKTRVYNAVFHPDGERVAVPDASGAVRLWDLPDSGFMEQFMEMRGHFKEANIASFTRDGDRMATAGDDATVRVWDTRDGKPLWRAPLLRARTLELYSHNGWHKLGSGSGSEAAKTKPARTLWRGAVEERGRLADESTVSNQLCLQTIHDTLEIWDTRADRRLSTRELPGLDRVLALGPACVSLAGGTARLHQADGGEGQVLAKEVTAAALDRDRLLLAAGSKVLTFDGAGRPLRTAAGARGVTALVMLGGKLALGFPDGNIEIKATGAKEKGAGANFAFEGVPSSPVLRMIPGPRGTLIAGYASGMLGLWNLDNGRRLDMEQLHGPVVHLLLKGRMLHAASDLGQHVSLDLAAFHEPYCKLLRKVWGRVPVVWRAGLPVLDGPPAGHKCSTEELTK